MHAEKNSIRLWLLAGAFSILIMLAFSAPIRKIIAFQYKKIQTHTFNFFPRWTPRNDRGPIPAVPLEKEAELERAFGRMFMGFTQAQWDELWHILYGLYPLQEPAEPGLPNRMRQLSQEEIISELRSRYPDPFMNFNEKKWEAFFSIVFTRR